MSTPDVIPTVIHPEHATFWAKRTQYCRRQVGRIARMRGIAARPPTHIPTCIQGSNAQCNRIIGHKLRSSRST